MSEPECVLSPRRTSAIASADRRYEFTGSIDASRVSGTPEAMLATQTDAVHYFQQPDSHLPLDSARTSLSGDAEQIKFGKFGGGITRFQTSFNRMSPGFEANDLGYLQRADLKTGATGFRSTSTHPHCSLILHSSTSTSGITGTTMGCSSSAR